MLLLSDIINLFVGMAGRSIIPVRNYREDPAYLRLSRDDKSHFLRRIVLVNPITGMREEDFSELFAFTDPDTRYHFKDFIRHHPRWQTRMPINDEEWLVIGYAFYPGNWEFANGENYPVDTLMVYVENVRNRSENAHFNVDEIQWLDKTYPSSRK